MVKRILITFGDNDFQTVMRAFGELFLRGKPWNETLLTKANIVRWFNAVAPTLYEMIQHNDWPTSTPTSYLTIEERQVYIGVEVEKKMDTYIEWANGDAVLIDFAAFKPMVCIL